MRRMNLLFLAALALAGDCAAQDEVIYKCTNSSGATYYTAEAKPGCTVASVNKRAPTQQPSQPRPQGLYGSPPPQRASSGVIYANCTEARAAGAAPVKRGDPGYSRKLDRDGDGVGCE